MVRALVSREETVNKRIWQACERFQYDDLANLREKEENLIIFIRESIVCLTPRQRAVFTDEFLLQSVDLWLQLNKDDSSVSSLGNLADDSSNEDSTIDLSRRSFNAPGWERLPASPPTPRIYRQRHVALPRPEQPDAQSSTEPETDATNWSEKSYAPAPESPIYTNDFSAVNPENNPFNDDFNGNDVPLAQSTFVIYLTPVANLYGDQEVPMTLEEEAQFSALAENQLENYPQELQNNNAYVALNEE